MRKSFLALATTALAGSIALSAATAEDLRLAMDRVTLIRIAVGLSAVMFAAAAFLVLSFAA